MLKTFPNFSDLSIEDKNEIERITNQFSPYSDFNFVSLWCYDLSDKTGLSILNNNLVIRMEDYTTADIFYMFIGKNKVEETIKELFEFLKQNNLPQELYLLPEEMLADCIDRLKQKYKVEEDRDNFDYIINVDNIAKMEGSALHQKKKLLNKFLKNQTPNVRIVNLSDTNIKNEILSFFDLWKKNKGKYNSKNEEVALNNLFKGLIDQSNIYVLLAEYRNQVIGFSIFEILENGYAVGDFQKGDVKYKGIYEFLNYSIAKFLKEKKCKYYNIEQDLGIEGLRRAKLDYDPIFLKKYTIKNV